VSNEGPKPKALRPGGPFRAEDFDLRFMDEPSYRHREAAEQANAKLAGLWEALEDMVECRACYLSIDKRRPLLTAGEYERAAQRWADSEASVVAAYRALKEKP
jgi:hypothetical protein